MASILQPGFPTMLFNIHHDDHLIDRESAREDTRAKRLRMRKVSIFNN